MYDTITWADIQAAEDGRVDDGLYLDGENYFDEAAHEDQGGDVDFELVGDLFARDEVAEARERARVAQRRRDAYEAAYVQGRNAAKVR